MQLLAQAAIVALGSMAGGLARWGVGLAAGRWLGATYPYGTFVINVAGSLFLGWFLTMLAESEPPDDFAWRHGERLRLLLAVGFAGSFTTFSTFEWESHALLARGDHLAAAIYVLGSVLVGLIAVRLGVQMARA